MPASSDDNLVGFGMNPIQASMLGANPVAVAGVGTSQTGAATLKGKSCELTTSGGQTAFIIPAVRGMQEPQHVFTSSATTALVFVPVGHTLNGTLNGSLSVAQNKAAILWQYNKGFWASLLAA
jgi:hypothetical protein